MIGQQPTTVSGELGAAHLPLFSQGNLFRDVPLAYPMPADELLVDESDAAGDGGRRFLSGPLAFGPAMLTTPSCSLGAQGAAGYAHPVRTLVQLLPLTELVGRGIVKETALPDLRRFDHHQLHLPPAPRGRGARGRNA